MDFKLYEIGEKYRQALENIQVDPDTGVVTGLEEVRELSGAFDTKAEAIACYIKELSAVSASIKAEMDQLKRRKETVEKTADRLRGYLSGWMGAMEKDRLKTAKVSISFRKTSACQILDVELIPPGFCSVEIKPQKSAITKAIRSGESVPGARLVESQTLLIR